jgi:hypothetical protein
MTIQILSMTILLIKNQKEGSMKKGKFEWEITIKCKIFAKKLEVYISSVLIGEIFAFFRKERLLVTAKK